MTSRRPPTKRPYEQVARAQAAEETARRILEAFVARLMTHWLDEITLDRVAADAGVTVQTVVRRFGGKDGLLAAAPEVLKAQVLARRASPSSDLESLVEGVVRDYEEVGDSIVRLLALEERHPKVGELLAFGRREHRAWVAEAFEAAPEALDALVLVTDVYTWKLLRRDMGRSVAATIRTVQGLVRGVLAEFKTPKP
jgi:AcrR family transcriptional regulator